VLRFRTGSWNELHIVESSPLGVIVTRFGGRKLLPGRSETAARPVGNCCPVGRELLPGRPGTAGQRRPTAGQRPGTAARAAEIRPAHGVERRASAAEPHAPMKSGLGRIGTRSGRSTLLSGGGLRTVYRAMSPRNPASHGHRGEPSTCHLLAGRATRSRDQGLAVSYSVDWADAP